VGSAVAYERQPFKQIVRRHTVANPLSIGFEIRKCLQGLGSRRGRAAPTVLLEAHGGVLVFQLVAFADGVDQRVGAERSTRAGKLPSDAENPAKAVAP